MSKVLDIQNSLVTSLKSGDSEKVSTYRLIISELKNYAIDQKVPVENLTDGQVEAVLEKQAKQRKDSIEAYTKASREDLVKKEQAELDIIQSLLPQKLSKEETEKIVDQLISDLNITQMSQMGLIMAEISKKYGTSVDKALVSQLTKQKLS